MMFMGGNAVQISAVSVLDPGDVLPDQEKEEGKQMKWKRRGV